MYTPSPVPHDSLTGMERYLQQELQRIADHFRSFSVDGVQLAVRNVAPSKPRDGLVVFADGTNWNPGTGRGVYVYSSGAWVKL